MSYRLETLTLQQDTTFTWKCKAVISVVHHACQKWPVTLNEKHADTAQTFLDLPYLCLAEFQDHVEICCLP